MRKNINPRIWGGPGWEFIDAVVDGYPESPSGVEKIAMTHFLSSLEFVLPCEECRKNYANFVKKTPLDVRSRRLVKDWLKKYKEASNPINQRLEYLMSMN